MNGNSQLYSREYTAGNCAKPIGKKTSRLDLIDNTQLTSFPLAHPIGEEDESLVAGGEYESSFTSDRTITDKENRCQAKGGTTVGKSKWNSCRMAQRNSRKRPLEEVNESEPLVLVEDYIEDAESIFKNLEPQNECLSNTRSRTYGHKCRKRISVLDFKESMRQESTGCSTRRAIPEPSFMSGNQNFSAQGGSSSDNSKRASLSMYSLELKHKPSAFSTISTLSSVTSGHDDTEPYVREIIEEQPSVARESGRLKYCVICDRPLYETSSLIPANRNFKELVCSDCFEEYENIWGSLKAMYSQEEEEEERKCGEKEEKEMQSTDNATDYSVNSSEAETESSCFANNTTLQGTECETQNTAILDTYSASNNQHSNLLTDCTFSSKYTASECSVSRMSSDTYKNGLLERTIHKLKMIKKRDDSIRSRLLRHKRSTLSTWIMGDRDRRDNRPTKKRASTRSMGKFNMHTYRENQSA